MDPRSSEKGLSLKLQALA